MEKRNKKSILAIILVLLVIIGCIMAYAYVKTDIFKSPQQLFKKYLAKNIEQIEAVNLHPLDEILTKTENKPIETSFVVEMESEGENIDFVINSKSDIQKQKSYSNINITNGEKKYFNLEALIENNTLGIQIDELHDKYIALENRDLKKVLEAFEIDEEIISEIPNEINLFKTEYTEEEKKIAKEIREKYLEKIDSQILEDRYKMEKNVQLQINEKEIIADKYTLTLGKKETINLYNNILSELLDDEEFIKLYEKNGSKDELKKLKEELIIPKEEIEKMEDSEIKFSVYESDSKTVKTEIITVDSNFEFCIDNNINDSTISFIANIAKNGQYDVGEKISFVLNNKYENQIGTMTLEVSNEYNKEDVKILQESEDESWSLYYDEEYYAETYKDEKYKFTLATEKKDENNMITTISSDSINSLLENEENSLVVNKCELLYKFDNNIEIPKFTEENSIIINDYTQKDYQKLGTDILGNAYNNASKYPDSIISLFVNYYIYITKLSSQSTVLSEPNLDAGYYNY